MGGGVVDDGGVEVEGGVGEGAAVLEAGADDEGGQFGGGTAEGGDLGGEVDAFGDDAGGADVGGGFDEGAGGEGGELAGVDEVEGFEAGGGGRGKGDDEADGLFPALAFEEGLVGTGAVGDAFEQGEAFGAVGVGAVGGFFDGVGVGVGGEEVVGVLVAGGDEVAGSGEDAGTTRLADGGGAAAEFGDEVGAGGAILEAEEEREVVDAGGGGVERGAGGGEGVVDGFVLQGTPGTLQADVSHRAETDRVHAELVGSLADAGEGVGRVEEDGFGAHSADVGADFLEEGDLAEGIADADDSAELGDEGIGVVLEGDGAVIGEAAAHVAGGGADDEVGAVEGGVAGGVGGAAGVDAEVGCDAVTGCGGEFDELAADVHEGELDAGELVVEEHFLKHSRAEDEAPRTDHGDLEICHGRKRTSTVDHVIQHGDLPGDDAGVGTPGEGGADAAVLERDDVWGGPLAGADAAEGFGGEGEVFLGEGHVVGEEAVVLGEAGEVELAEEVEGEGVEVGPGVEVGVVAGDAGVAEVEEEAAAGLASDFVEELGGNAGEEEVVLGGTLIDEVFDDDSVRAEAVAKLSDIGDDAVDGGCEGELTGEVAAPEGRVGIDERGVGVGCEVGDFFEGVSGGGAGAGFEGEVDVDGGVHAGGGDGVGEIGTLEEVDLEQAGFVQPGGGEGVVEGETHGGGERGGIRGTWGKL